jgi:hypothetical protein
VEGPRRIRIACIVALVFALHLTALWGLLTNSRFILKPMDSQGFEIVLIPRSLDLQQQAAASETKRHESTQARLRRQPPSGGAPNQPAPAEEESNAIHGPIDWANELGQTAKDATADKSAQTPKDFGFPHRPSAPAKAPQFEWDYAATHRVESIDGGGLLLHLDDRCVLVLFPLPLIGCGIGTKPANGELLKHMGDLKEGEPASVP